MNNCLVTKLKDNVQNDSLVTIGEYRFSVNLNSDLNLAFATLNSRNQFTLKCINNERNILYNGESYDTLSGIELRNIGFKAGNYEVSLMSKYDIGTFDFYGNSTFIMNIDNLSYSIFLIYLHIVYPSGKLSSLKSCERLSTINFTSDTNERPLYGTISDLADLPNIKFLRIGGKHLTGNIIDVLNYRNIQNMTSIDFTYQENITGDLTELVSGLRIKRGTTGNISLGLCRTQVNVGNYRMNEDTVAHNLAWTNDTYIYKLGSDADIEDLSKDVNIYTYGYTQEQVQALRDKGNHVYVIS